ncbi:TIGR02679 domain-containing protein [Streptomyces viridiviolaceus]
MDDGSPQATLTLSGFRVPTSFTDGSGAEWRGEAWASAGLLKDELSSVLDSPHLELARGPRPALDGR